MSATKRSPFQILPACNACPRNISGNTFWPQWWTWLPNEKKRRNVKECTSPTVTWHESLLTPCRVIQPSGSKTHVRDQCFFCLVHIFVEFCYSLGFGAAEDSGASCDSVDFLLVTWFQTSGIWFIHASLVGLLSCSRVCPLPRLLSHWARYTSVTFTPWWNNPSHSGGGATPVGRRAAFTEEMLKVDLAGFDDFLDLKLPFPIRKNGRFWHRFSIELFFSFFFSFFALCFSFFWRAPEPNFFLGGGTPELSSQIVGTQLCASCGVVRVSLVNVVGPSGDVEQENVVQHQKSGFRVLGLGFKV